MAKAKKPNDTIIPEAKKRFKHMVINVFRDKHNFDKKYQPGDDVSHFDAERLANLVNTEHVEVK
jgi:hypothetical protein